MRLYLSSYKLGNKPEELVRLVGEKNKRVAVIANASDCKDEGVRQEKLNIEMSNLRNLGFAPEEVDLRKYFDKEEELRELISQFGLVWVKGGNALVLQRAFEQSGLNKILKDFIAEDRIVYAGYSAGICVISPTLRGVELVDDPKILPPGYRKDFSWEGMNLINYNVAMHYKSDHPESADVEKEVEFLQNNNLPYKTLKDGEVIVINGNKETIFTLEMMENKIPIN